MASKDEITTLPGGIYARKHSIITAPKRKYSKPTSAGRSFSQSTSGTQTALCKSATGVACVDHCNAWTNNCGRRGRDTVRIELLAPSTPADRRAVSASSKPTPAFRPGGGAHFSRWRPTSAPRNLGESKELMRREQTRPYSALPVRCSDGKSPQLMVHESLSPAFRPNSGAPVISIPYTRTKSSNSMYFSMKCPRDYVVKINFTTEK